MDKKTDPILRGAIRFGARAVGIAPGAWLFGLRGWHLAGAMIGGAASLTAAEWAFRYLNDTTKKVQPEPDVIEAEVIDVQPEPFEPEVVGMGARRSQRRPRSPRVIDVRGYVVS